MIIKRYLSGIWLESRLKVWTDGHIAFIEVNGTGMG